MATAKKSSAPRKVRSPSELAVDRLMKMPMGELVRFTELVVDHDVVTAGFLADKLRDALDERAQTRRAGDGES